MPRARKKLAENGPMDANRAFQVLFHEPKTARSLWDWLARLGVPLRDRGEVSQEVLLAAYQSFHSYDPVRSPPERWLNGITVHIASHYRDRAYHRREELTPNPPLDLEDELPRADEQIERIEERFEIWDVLQRVDDDLRSVLVAHDIDGIPMAEIAAQNGIPLSTAYKWRARAIVSCKAMMEQRRREEDERIDGSGART